MITEHISNEPLQERVDSEKFAGLVVKDVLDPVQESNVLDHIRTIQRKHELQSTLLDRTTSSEKPYYDIDLQNNLKLKIGHLNSFSQAEIACIVFEQARVYTDLATMGDSFPRHDIESEEMLVAAFLESTNENIVVSVQYKTPLGRKMIGGCMVVLNDSEQPLIQSALSNNSYESALPTFQSLRLIAVDERLETTFSSTKERDVVNPIRFWRQDKNTLERLGVTDRSIASKIVASIPLGYRQYSLNRGAPIPPYALVDTHDPHVVSLIEKNFGAHIFAKNGEIAPTEEVLSTILKYHYGDETHGGYFGQITISYFETEEFMKRSLTLLETSIYDSL